MVTVALVSVFHLVSDFVQFALKNCDGENSDGLSLVDKKYL